MKRFAGTVVAVLLLSTAALAGPDQQAGINNGCQTSTNWSESACACISEAALSLTETQQSFLAATLNEQKAEAGRFAVEMSVSETLEVSMFMMKSGPACQ